MNSDDSRGMYAPRKTIQRSNSSSSVSSTGSTGSTGTVSTPISSANGTPVSARLRAECAELTRYVPQGGAARPVKFDPKRVPLETFVEREAVHPKPGALVRLRVSVEAGQQFLRVLGGAPLDMGGFCCGILENSGGTSPRPCHGPLGGGFLRADAVDH